MDHGLKLLLQYRVTHHSIAGLDCGRFTLNMREDGGNFRDVAADFRFQDSHHIVGVFQAESFVQLQMKFRMQPAFKVLDADIMNAEIIA